MLSFEESRYSLTLIPQVPWVNGLPNPRLPKGGKRASDTICLALSAVDTYKWYKFRGGIGHKTTASNTTYRLFLFQHLAFFDGTLLFLLQIGYNVIITLFHEPGLALYHAHLAHSLVHAGTFAEAFQLLQSEIFQFCFALPRIYLRANYAQLTL